MSRGRRRRLTGLDVSLTTAARPRAVEQWKFALFFSVHCMPSLSAITVKLQPSMWSPLRRALTVRAVVDRPTLENARDCVKPSSIYKTP